MFLHNCFLSFNELSFPGLGPGSSSSSSASPPFQPGPPSPRPGLCPALAKPLSTFSTLSENYKKHLRRFWGMLLGSSNKKNELELVWSSSWIFSDRPFKKVLNLFFLCGPNPGLIQPFCQIVDSGIRTRITGLDHCQQVLLLLRNLGSFQASRLRFKWFPLINF